MSPFTEEFIMEFCETRFAKQLLAVVMGTALVGATVATFTIPSIGILGWGMIVGKIVASVAAFTFPLALACVMPERINAKWLRPMEPDVQARR
jgi:hypothetical protein